MMREFPLPGTFALALFAFASLGFGSTAYAVCGDGIEPPACVHTADTSEAPGFDITNKCGNYQVSLNVKAPGSPLVNFVFTLGVDETMSNVAVPEIPSDWLERLTAAHENGEVTVLCCPFWSKTSHCADPN